MIFRVVLCSLHLEGGNGGNFHENSTAGFLHFRNQRQGMMKRFLWYALCVLCLLVSFYGMYGNSVLYKCRDLICLFLTKWPSTMICERNTKAMAWLLKYFVIEELQDIFDVCTAAPQNGVHYLCWHNPFINFCTMFTFRCHLHCIWFLIFFLFFFIIYRHCACYRLPVYIFNKYEI